MEILTPIDTVELFPAIHAELIGLHGLDESDWRGRHLRDLGASGMSSHICSRCSTYRTVPDVRRTVDWYCDIGFDVTVTALTVEQAGKAMRFLRVP